MATGTVSRESIAAREITADGSAMAAFLAGGIGAFAMAAIVLLNEAGILAPPALYAPAGGVSGRTTLATVTWLIAWSLLHRHWKDRQISTRRVWTTTLILIGLSILGTLPPIWKFLGLT